MRANAVAPPLLEELFLFFPSKYPNGNWTPSRLQFQDVWLTSGDGQAIHAWYCPADEPRAFVLYAHGNAGNITHQAGFLEYLQARTCVSVLAFDYRGYGRSGGVPSVEGALMDARASHKKLAQLADVDPSEVVLMGRSLGGAIMIQLAAESQPRALIVESTFSSLREIADVRYPQLANLVARDKLDSVDAISRYQGQLLCSHGTADRVIPYRMGKFLFERANEPKQFVTVRGAGHTNSRSRFYLTQLDNFFGRLETSSADTRQKQTKND